MEDKKVMEAIRKITARGGNAEVSSLRMAGWLFMK